MQNTLLLKFLHPLVRCLRHQVIVLPQLSLELLLVESELLSDLVELLLLALRPQIFETANLTLNFECLQHQTQWLELPPVLLENILTRVCQ